MSAEPISLTVDILRSNARRLGLRNVEFFNCAMSDVKGVIAMEVPLYESGAENFYEARVTSEESTKGLRREMVISETIDSLFSKLDETISFIKCDVEGHELNCVKGAVHIIKVSKPAWLIEISDDPDDPQSTSSELFRLLSEEGYDAYWFDGRNLKRRGSGDKSVNYFLLSSKHVERLRSFGSRVLDIS